MPDDIVLNGPQGSVYNLGSWLRADPGPDYGEKDLLKHVYSENTAIDGGAYAYETMGVRRMVFPVYLASGGAGLSLTQLQGALRLAAKPGATLDVRLDGEASSALIRFDVLGGRVKPEHSIPIWREDRLPASIEVDTQPVGYMPTVIVLASVASMALPGSLSIPNANLLGDMPGMLELYVDATAATYYPAGSWTFDMVAWSVAGGSGGSPFWSGASLTALRASSTVVGDAFAPASQALDTYWNGVTAWTRAAYVAVGSAIAPRYRGRHRLYAWARLGPSQALPWYVSADAGYIDGASYTALASAGPVATLPPAIASGAPGAFGAQPSPAHTLLDLGEITLPAVASGLPDANYIRLWVSPASSGGGVATPIITFAGLYLHALDGPNGVMPRGIGWPSVGNVASSSRFAVDAVTGNVTVKQHGATHALSDARAHYRGGLPLAGATTTRLDLLGGYRKASVAATAPVVHAAGAFAKAAVLYRPRFMWLRGI